MERSNVTFTQNIITFRHNWITFTFILSSFLRLPYTFLTSPWRWWQFSRSFVQKINVLVRIPMPKLFYQEIVICLKFLWEFHRQIFIRFRMYPKKFNRFFMIFDISMKKIKIYLLFSSHTSTLFQLTRKSKRSSSRTSWTFSSTQLDFTASNSHRWWKYSTSN